MAENKTAQTQVSPKDFITSVEHPGRQEDALALLKLLEKWTGWKPKMWGPSIIGFGRYDYTYESGHSGSSCVVGFSPRKANLVLYISRDHPESAGLVEQLGKVKASQGCLYAGRLSTIDLGVLEKLVGQGVAAIKDKWPVTGG